MTEPDTHPTTSATHKLVVTRAESVVMSKMLSEGGSMVIGRSPAAQVSINDPRMSRMHAIIWIENGEAWARDLGSTNGTNINGQRITAPHPLGVDALLQIGDLTLQLRTQDAPCRHAPMLWLENKQTGLRRSITDAPIQLGASVVIHQRDGATWLEDSLGQRPMSIGDNVDADGRCWQLVDTEAVGGATDVSTHHGPPYRIWAPENRRVMFRDLTDKREHTISSVRRSQLLHTLGLRLQQDRAHRKTTSQQGWLADDELGLSVWGEAWVGSASNRLNVLIHRIRRELEDAGFSSECLQKQRGAARVWLQQPRF